MSLVQMRCLQVPIDSCVSSPLLHHPIANPKFESEFFHVHVVWIEMLMVHHAGRDMNGITLLPVISLPTDLRVTVAL